MRAYRPTLTGTRHMISAGHHAAAHAGFTILEGGGNAVDAGVAAGIALGVLQTDLVNFAGVAPIMIYLADQREVVTIDGLGTWPSAADINVFRARRARRSRRLGMISSGGQSSNGAPAPYARSASTRTRGYWKAARIREDWPTH
jgi:gamma-glutamyltranspeptidase